MSYCVYQHIRLDTGVPFYVGKGRVATRRAYKMTIRNRLHKNIQNKTNIKVEILKYFEDETEAYDFEEKLINLYKLFGYCKANLGTGGQITSGYVAWNKGIPFSKEARAKMAKAQTGKRQSKETIEKRRKNLIGKNKGKPVWITGKGHSEETKKKIGAASKGRHVGRVCRQKTRDKMSKAMIGKNRLLRNFKMIQNEKVIWEGNDAYICADLFKLDVRGINRCLNLKTKTHKSYQFILEEL